MKHWFGNAMRGFCMGLADVVPGVSGGTVALILGIYPRLVDAVGSVGAGMLARVPTRAFRAALRRGLRDPAGRGAGPGGVEDPNGVEDPDGVDARRVLLLASVGAGIVPAILVGSEVLPGLLSAYPEQMKGLFLGLVAASVMIPASQALAPRKVGTGRGCRSLHHLVHRTADVGGPAGHRHRDADIRPGGVRSAPHPR